MALGGYDQGKGFDTMFGGAAGDLLGQQVQDETEEMKRRRQLLAQMQEAVSPLGASSMLGLRKAMGSVLGGGPGAQRRY
ncbi:MAG TPA: hypothetical protein VF901_21970 [Bradyrhizobium sp.]